MKLILKCQPLWIHGCDSGEKIIFHCIGNSIDLQLWPWMKYINCVLMEHLSDPQSEIHVICGTVGAQTIKQIDKLLREQQIITRDQDKIIGGLTTFGFKIKRKGKNISIQRSELKMSINSIENGSTCLMCAHGCTLSVAPLIGTVVMESSSDSQPQASGEGTGNDSCICEKRVLQDIAADILAFRDLSECSPQVIRDKSTIKCLLNDSSDFRLNGRVTEAEQQAGMDFVQPKPVAFIGEIDKLRIMHCLKENRKPFLSIHNLSVIIDRCPTDDYNAHSKHICILCCSVLTNRISLLTHIQNKHTGFWFKCPDCWRFFRDERCVKKHYRNNHGELISGIHNVCTLAKPIYTPEGVEIGRKFLAENNK